MEETKPTAAASFPKTFAEARTWMVENKLRTVGTLWASGITGSVLYNMRKPGEKMSVKIIHARMHAQAFTLAALVAAAGLEYYEHSRTAAATEAKANVQQHPL
eukprot:TRINITY_DN7237_c0_g1_i1.p1 TRINITY_DN7237_c0_g1~~TRINITY_DN7237_c0_g1_i1.p1  ORF type:complete len:103 (-),score=16.95 TRINITY_DN7237_c0_g1_i1:288-596(-)